jgi:hypothetical protein
MRLIGYLATILIIVFGIWPYYHLYRLDDALGRDDMPMLAELVNVDAIRANYKNRLNRGLESQAQPDNPAGALLWLQQGLQRLGDTALEQTISLEWVRDTLKQSASSATSTRPAYFLAGVEFAFFESWDSFIVRLGELGMGETHVRLRLDGTDWRVTDIIR